MEHLTTRDLLELYVFAENTEIQKRVADILGDYPFN